MANRLALLSCCVLLAFAVGKIHANSYYWDFDTSDGGYVNTGGRAWIWSGTGSFPDFSDMTDPVPPSTGNYWWLQDNVTPPNTGTIVSTPATNVTIYPNDEICITIFRHLNVFTGEDNPVLSLVTNGGTHNQPVLWSYNYEVWDKVSLICGPGDEPCCQTFPCTGYFAVYGEIDAWGDVLAIDNIGVNSFCRGETPTSSPPPPPPPTSPPTSPPTTTTTTTTTTPPPTTTTRPPSWCCNFNTADVCTWSPSFLVEGFIWSGYVLPCVYPNPSPSPFIYVQSVSGYAYSVPIPNVDSTTVFSFEYYYYSYGAVAPQVEVGFMDLSFTVQKSEVLVYTTGTPFWTQGILDCYDGRCCPGGVQPCTGYFYIRATAYPGVYFGFGFDAFSVDYTPC